MKRRMRRIIERDVRSATARSYSWRDAPSRPRSPAVKDSITFRVEVAPSTHRDRWDWKVRIIVGGIPDSVRYSEMPYRWSDGPCSFHGTTRDAASADLAVREVMDVATSVHAAMVLRPPPARWEVAA